MHPVTTLRSLIILTGLTLFTLIISCASNPDEGLVVEAQACLNQVPVTNPDSAQACLAKIQHLDSPSAHQIRCSAAFIQQGFSNPVRLTQVAEQLANAGDQGSSGTLVAIGLLAFTEGVDPKAEAERALLSCQKAGSKGMTLLASMSSLATAMTQSGIGSVVTDCDNPENPQDCADSVTEVLCNTDDPAATDAFYTEMGAIAILTYQSSCRFNLSADPMCQVYAAATNNGTITNETTVGENLKNYLTDAGGDDLCTP